MLTFYYHPLSPISRRVWLALLEKEIPYQPVIVDLSKREQFQTDFLTLNPFHHIPVIVENGFRVIESIAILDYLEDQHPHIPLVPACHRERTTMRMIQMVTVNELVSKLSKVINQDHVPLTADVKQQLNAALTFLNSHVGKGGYFGDTHLNLADIVVGATVPLFCRLGIGLTDYPALNQWNNHITARLAWQATNPSDVDFEAWKQLLQRWIRIAMKRQKRQHQNN
ncbi:glutathione S-transferase family protein [Leptothoe sp. LEGE 181152]|nr:glutathione S-transferase family protein [Leptothoe sp. LEGE 181152]